MRTRAWILAAAVLLAACGDDDGGSARIVSGESTIELREGGATAVVERDPFRITFRAASLVASDGESGGLFYRRGDSRFHVTRVVADREQEGDVLLEVETSEGDIARARVGFEFDDEAERYSSRVLSISFDPPRPESVTWIGARLTSPPEEVVYGLTERLRDGADLAPAAGLEVDLEEAFPVEVGSLDRRGDKVRMRVRPTFAIYGPFYQTSSGYGLLVDGTTLGEYDVASTDPEVIEFRFQTGTAAGGLRFWIIDGPDHPTILDEYTRMTGRPYVPPEWAFRHWRWRNELMFGEPALLDGIEMNAQVVEDISMYEMLDIPVGVYLFDRPVLEGDFGFARFAWDEERLPNPTAMIESLQRRGYRLSMWSGMWACGSGPNDLGTEANRLGYIAPSDDPTAEPNCENLGGANFIIDVTHPDVPNWFSTKLTEFCAANDIQGIKLDRGEEHIPSERGDIWADGRSGVEVRNAYPTIQAKIHHDAMRDAFGDDALVITRSGYTGTQRWAIVWGGDTPGRENFGTGAGTDLGLRAAIIKQLRAAFLGYPIWGSDTGGYYEFRDREVFARWLSFSAFSGIMEIGGFGAHAPWNMPTDPTFDVEMVEIYRRYTQLRETLLPYLVELAREAGESGMPMARPMVFEFPDDDRLLDMWDQYMFGPDLMVAPIWKIGQTERSIYFPDATWTSYWDDSVVIKGPATVEVEVPLDRIAVYVRDGASVPRP